MSIPTEGLLANCESFVIFAKHIEIRNVRHTYTSVMVLFKETEDCTLPVIQYPGLVVQSVNRFVAL